MMAEVEAQEEDQKLAETVDAELGQRKDIKLDVAEAKR